MDTTQVLIVDDDPMLLQALSQTIALHMSMVEVKAVSSAREALDLLQGHTYGAVVSDIKMPGIDGLALLAQLQERHAEVPVLLITGHSDHQLAIRALRGGAYDYILKPIDRDDFIAALHRALHTHQLRQQIEEQQRALERYALSLERLVNQRTRELAAANTARETLLRDFIAGLRSPLASLQTLAQKISQSLPQGEEMKPILDDMARLQQSVRQMDEVVREVESSLNAQEFA